MPTVYTNIFVRLKYDLIMEFLIEIHIPYNLQFGSRKHHSLLFVVNEFI